VTSESYLCCSELWLRTCIHS